MFKKEKAFKKNNWIEKEAFDIEICMILCKRVVLVPGARVRPNNNNWVSYQRFTTPLNPYQHAINGILSQLAQRGLPLTVFDIGAWQVTSWR